MLTQEEQNALLTVDRELENSHVKIKVLKKKFTGNISNLSKVTENIREELKKSHTLAFLQVRANRMSQYS